ncbi:MAG: DUF2335 domain-containing protein [Verrucomicrobiae bacterium]|nr:DUF2335 domain-containing protein [Verrucomicrobiae bacterium]
MADKEKQDSSEIQQIEEALLQKKPHALDDIPKEKVDEILKLAIETIRTNVSIQESYSGAIPHPSHLKAFNEIVPGSADLIFQEFKKQSEHRRALESYAIPRQTDQSGRGQIFAFILVILFLIAGVLLTMYDHDKVGGILLGFTLLGVTSVFITGKIFQEKELASKKQQ